MSKIKKLGLGIVAFEGTEMIKNITWSIRDLCDFIVVCLQKVSYHGDPIREEDVRRVENLEKVGLIDRIIWFEAKDNHTDDSKGNGPRLIETDKRNFILDYLEYEAGCSHSMIIDSDEFYDHDDFENAKAIFDNSENIHITYCEYINYYRDYLHVMVWPFRSYVPFIAEAKYRFDFYRGNFNRPSDPTRRYVLDETDRNFTIYTWNTLKMHHLSWIRINIEDKIDAWSSKVKFSDFEELKTAILDRYYNYKDGMNAIIMFNVPQCQVVVNKLPKQYICPKFRIDEEPSAL